ncbi:unnamed protein product [Lactuca saligna]|uniref:Uncharacterized protein n=1 Tax=Lactuca saligna TaxID=75948 RepID=A0AA35YPK4_LACSI|nr:unnamed protein product [Lactuca saligna]
MVPPVAVATNRVLHLHLRCQINCNKVYVDDVENPPFTNSHGGKNIVFLNKHSHPRPGKGFTHHCEIYGRNHVEAFRFSSLGCMLGGMKRWDSKLSFTLKMNHTQLIRTRPPNLLL